MKKIAVFASGSGSNAQKIIEASLKMGEPTLFQGLEKKGNASKNYQVELVVSNKPDAGVLSIAKKEGIASLIIEKEKFFRGDAYVSAFKKAGIDLIILAGFLWKVPAALLQAFPNKIINIHPALLPKYGGKGMYGQYVHQAVINNKEKESGITIHYVDEVYDHGDIIFQATCPVLEGDTAESLALRIQLLEHLHYPAVIQRLLR